METETKRQTRVRLKAEGQGRWPAFWKRRERLVDDGMAPAQAHAEALKEFQPLDGRQVEPAGVASWVKKAAPVRGRESRRRVDWKKDVEWVYQNIGRAEPRGAPSAGARVLHQVAREQPRWFLEEFVQRMIPAGGGKEVPGAKPADDGTESLELIERLLRESEFAVKPDPEEQPK